MGLREAVGTFLEMVAVYDSTGWPMSPGVAARIALLRGGLVDLRAAYEAGEDVWRLVEEPDYMEVPVRHKPGRLVFKPPGIAGDYLLEAALNMPDFCGYVYEDEDGRWLSAAPRRVQVEHAFREITPGWSNVPPATTPVAVLFRKRADG